VGKRPIITIDGVDYNINELREYIIGLDSVKRKAMMKDIITRMMEIDPEGTRKAFRDAIKQDKGLTRRVSNV
jgi:hypothetical protein